VCPTVWRQIEHLKFTIVKLRHDRFGSSSERTSFSSARSWSGALRRRPPMRSLLRRPTRRGRRRSSGVSRPTVCCQSLSRASVRVVLPSPYSCCGGNLRSLGEDVTETLERVPPLRADHAMPAPAHPIARDRACPQLLSEAPFGKYGSRLPQPPEPDLRARASISVSPRWPIGSGLATAGRAPPALRKPQSARALVVVTTSALLLSNSHISESGGTGFGLLLALILRAAAMYRCLLPGVHRRSPRPWARS
jgi:hypothetical protein